MNLQWQTATEDEIIQHCSPSNPNRVLVSALEGGLSVIRVSEDAVIKFGFGVTLLEAQNQQRAYEILNTTVIRVPKIYRYFSRERDGLHGYIIMEHIDGRSIDSLDNPDVYLEPVARFLKQFEQICHNKPGPFPGGLAIGQLWLDYDLIAPSSISDIELYYNQRQLKNIGPIKLEGYPLIFCHLDIAPRNILVMKDGSICLIDWESAGFYPRLFERVALRIHRQKDNDWNSRLLERLGELGEGEARQAQL